MWESDSKHWLQVGEINYNLNVLLRIETTTDGGYILKHQNQTVTIDNIPANADLITKIKQYLECKSL